MRHYYSILSLLILQCFVAITNLYGQDGNPYLTHYQLPSGVSNQNWGFAQGENGLMFILNRKGIYSFDGLQWENLGISGRPISIAYSNNLFFCSDKGVGYLVRESDGTYIQEIIIKSDTSNFFYSFTHIDDGLLVVSPQAICRIKTSGEVAIDTLYHENRPEVFISDFFQLKGQMYHVKNRALIYLNKPYGGYEMLDGLPIGQDMEFSFIHGKYAFFGSSSNNLYRFDGRSLSLFTIKDQDYLDASVLNGGVSVSDTTFALSTLNGGCLIVNSESGTTVNTLNYFSGLPDDEIFSLGTDRDGGLWISHAMGITRADLEIPISSLGFYEGLSGYMLSCIEYDKKVYLGTSEGLFYLDEVRDYKVVDVFVRSREKNQKIDIQSSKEKEKDEKQSVEQKKRRFISSLFSRKKDDLIDEDAKSDLNSSSNKAKNEGKTIKKRIYELQSVSHKYKRIEGLKGKVRQLILHNEKLFAATNFGLYEIDGSKQRLVIPNVNIAFIQESRFSKNQLILGTSNGVYIASNKGINWSAKFLSDKLNSLVISVVEIEQNSYLVSTEFDVFIFSKNKDSEQVSKKVSLPGTELSIPILRAVENEIFAFTSAGVFEFNKVTSEFFLSSDFQYVSTFSLLYNQRDFTWVRDRKEWYLMLPNGFKKDMGTSYVNLLDNVNYISVSNDSILYIVNQFENVYRIKPTFPQKDEKPVSIFINKITGPQGKLINPNDIELEYSNNSILIRISAPSYIKEGSIQFQYKISELMENWSEWTNNPVLEFPFFSPGEYVISIRAKNILGNSSDIVSLPLRIRPPFWQTIWFLAICLILLMVLLMLVIKYRERTLRREKEVLEQKVKERTKTIEEQNKVLTNQRDQIFKQNEEITQSITYARKIQTAVMPSMDVIDSLLGDYFIMFRPRDIVSGDFYWMTEHNNRVVVVAADCTGHGVPGAFMSMMGVSFLNDIVNVDGQTQPDIILNILREKIKSTLYQIGKDGETRDGMDISVCVFLRNTRTLMYAGAYNPLYILRKGELIEYKADKMPVGVHPKEKEPFTLHNIKLEAEDNLYIFSDGFVSQFGGPDGRKFMAKPYKELLTKMYGKSMAEQKIILEDTMDKWQAAFDQVDDILVIGIAVK